MSWSIRIWIMCLFIIYYGILRFIKFISRFVILLEYFKIWFANGLRINIFFGYLWFHSNHFNNGHLFWWTCYFIDFTRLIFGWFQISRKRILISNTWLSWILLIRTLQLGIFAKIVFLRCFGRQLWEILIPSLFWGKIVGAETTWFHNISGKRTFNHGRILVFSFFQRICILNYFVASWPILRLMI